MNVIDQEHGEAWSAYNGDSAEVLAALPGASVDHIVTSIPFDDLYVYTASERDIGNCKSTAEFFEHLGYVTSQLYRLLRPGRVAAIHVMDIPATLVNDGYIGLKDFSGDVVRHFIGQGFVYDARIPIDKNQQLQANRTHPKGLTFAQLERDQVWSRPALPDYVLKFRKPGTNAVPVQGGDISRDTWIEWANPSWPNEHDRCADAGAFATWYGIKENDTLNALASEGYAGLTASRDRDDGRHVCPLQLPVIERSVRLWSNAGDVVLDPFGGIGSTAFQAVTLKRRALSVELKPTYYRAGVWNLRRLEASQSAQDMFSLFEAEPAEVA